MKVYLVTHGDYSDYQINAVFSTRKKAEEFMGNAPSKHFGIEEWELDVERPRVWGPFWQVGLKLDGSEVKDSTWNYPSRDATEQHYSGERGIGETAAGFYDDRRNKTSTWFFGQSYVSHEHAMKLAVEQRQKALREHPEFF